ncbi:MAG: glycosyltransferase family 39 protein, partial [Pseudomonadota bacterium]
MANVAVTRSESWLGPALAVVLGVTALRIALMAFNRTDLFVDEAQYWLWGQSLEWGYYSKPPLIGWVIRLSTDLAGSDAPFFVRLPAPLLHAAMALILGWIAAQRFGGQAAIWIAGLYVTMPAVSVGSYMISTDTVMFPFLGV